MHAEPTETETTGGAPDWGALLWFQAAIGSMVGFALTLIWLFTGFGYFWPMWIWFGLAVPLALQVSIRRALDTPPGPGRGLAVHGSVTSVLAGIEVVLWVLTGFGLFWPIFPISAFAIAYAVHFMTITRESPGQQELVARVDQLTRTRSGALDVQAAELRRIERDLHDGAQARLVALSMQIGRAEARLAADHPEEAELLREARMEAGAAIAELRDLARGIAPPVLADRGLGAAVEALGRRVAIPVDVEVSIDRRPIPVVETAAYFVVAEALANVSKHAPDATARVQLELDDVRLLVVISDDGPGGADASGGGLTGLRGRVEALDGTLSVVSEPDAGTTIRAELPCAS